jgi:small subunit ribosomal protein S17
MPEKTETETEVATEVPDESAGTPAPATVATGPVAKAAVATADVAAEVERRKNRKTREGLVVSDKMDKTAVVAVIERVRHAKYGKFMMRTKRLYAHDEANDAHTGDKVRVMETRPLSKNKRWRIVEVLERAK